MSVLRERVEMLFDARRERVRGIAVVMEMKLDFAEAGFRELREPVEIFGSILLAGKEPTMSRRAPVAISELTELRVCVDPRFDTCATDVVGSATVKWFVVVAQREQ